MFAMTVPLVPDEGWAVLHLFGKVTPHTDGEAITRAVKTAEEMGQQVVCFAVLGHKADVGFMLVGPDLVALRRSQSALGAHGARAGGLVFVVDRGFRIRQEDAGG